MNTSDVISLPLTASLIFSYMLSHQGKVLERAEIFDNVWSKYGHAPSNNTLTQYVSLIRKDLINLGLSVNVIVTIPKVGFIIPHEIDIEIQDVTSEENKGRAPNYELTNVFFYFSLLILIVSLISTFYFWKGYRLNEQVTYHLGYLNNCEVRGLSIMTPAQMASSLIRTKRYAEIYFPCTRDATYYIGLPHLAAGNKSSRFTLAQCGKVNNREGNLISCQSILFYE
ncbi:winged helix-turn-helix domain-containing protein [Klebsiella aerogenes]|uniref:winged helix-turn-helix domain-containing protein n=1 Tax=Klebsiella aerogenes TaxID=548 RepID=UPI0028DDA58A|nr:winged helix-turn-helix domain-containing protein [Klebsiella aerogenes]MDT8880972.1 winged helix-turn-helix domain-containing protein [Klebsiella aerogenes]